MLQTAKTISSILALLSLGALLSVSAFVVWEFGEQSEALMRESTETMRKVGDLAESARKTDAEVRGVVKRLDTTVARANRALVNVESATRRVDQELVPGTIALVDESKKAVFEGSYLLNDNMLYARGTMTNIQESSEAWRASSEESQRSAAALAVVLEELGGTTKAARALLEDEHTKAIPQRTEELLVEVRKAARAGKHSLWVNILTGVVGAIP